ncbi:MAG: hypothetical protein U0835_12710 [Isosphaeraceae bacterium]
MSNRTVSVRLLALMATAAIVVCGAGLSSYRVAYSACVAGLCAATIVGYYGDPFWLGFAVTGWGAFLVGTDPHRYGPDAVNADWLPAGLTYKVCSYALTECSKFPHVMLKLSNEQIHNISRTIALAANLACAAAGGFAARRIRSRADRRLGATAEHRRGFASDGISLVHALYAIAVFAITLLILREGSYRVAYSGCVAGLCSATIVGYYGDPFWLGFAVAGWAAFLLGDEPTYYWPGVVHSDWLPTYYAITFWERLLDYLGYERLSGGGNTAIRVWSSKTFNLLSNIPFALAAGWAARSLRRKAEREESRLTPGDS